jgi:hypothetical protein
MRRNSAVCIMTLQYGRFLIIISVIYLFLIPFFFGRKVSLKTDSDLTGHSTAAPVIQQSIFSVVAESLCIILLTMFVIQ